MLLFNSRVLVKTVLAPDIFRLRLSSDAGFAADTRPGKFVMLGFLGPSLDPLLLRPFGISGWNDSWFEVLIKVTGRGTRLLSHCQPGDELRVHGPLGNGYPLEKTGGSLLLVAGGMGLASILSVIHFYEGSPPQGSKLLYGAANAEQLIPVAELGLAEEFAREMVTDDGSWGRQALVTDLLREELSRCPDRLIFACGPEPMLRAVVSILRKSGAPGYVSLEKRMACGFGVCLGCVQKVFTKPGLIYRKVCSQGPVFPALEVDFDG